MQPRYNLLFRENERELFALCAEERIAVIPYNPLAGGLLTGKHRPGAPTEGTRFTLGHAGARYQERYWQDAMFATVGEFQQIAEDAGVPMTTLAIRWVLANPVITSPILGASRPDQLAASVAALDEPLDDDTATPPRHTDPRVPLRRPRPLSTGASACADYRARRHSDNRRNDDHGNRRPTCTTRSWWEPTVPTPPTLRSNTQRGWPCSRAPSFTWPWLRRRSPSWSLLT